MAENALCGNDDKCAQANPWTLVGHISSGDAVYFQKGGGLVVEKDHQYLAEPTPEEREEIRKTMSHLRPAIKEKEGS